MPELTPEQQTAVDELRPAMDAYGAALEKCVAAGLNPLEAMQAAGVDVAEAMGTGAESGGIGELFFGGPPA